MSEEFKFQFEVPFFVVLVENGFVSISTDTHTEETPEYAVAVFPTEPAAEQFITDSHLENAEVRTISSMADFVRFLTMFKEPHTHVAWFPKIHEDEYIRTEWVDSIEHILSQLPPLPVQPTGDALDNSLAPWRYPAFTLTGEDGKDFVAIQTQMPDGKQVKAVVLFSESQKAKEYREQSPLHGLKIHKIEDHESMKVIFDQWLEQFNAVVIDPIFTASGEASALCLWIENLREKYFV